MCTASMTAQHQCHPLFPQLSQAGDLIIEVYLEQKLPDCCVTLKVSPKGGPCGRDAGSWCCLSLGHILPPSTTAPCVSGSRCPPR